MNREEWKQYNFSLYVTEAMIWVSVLGSAVIIATIVNLF